MDLRSTKDALLARLYPQPEQWHPLTLKLVYSLRLCTTESGRATIILVGILGLLTANIGVGWPIYFLPVVFFSFLCMTAFPLFLFRPRVKVRRALPDRCQVGSEIIVKARATNEGRLPVFDLSLAEQDKYLRFQLTEGTGSVDALKPGETAHLSYRLKATKRGAHDLPGPVALSGFPFGLYHAMHQNRSPHRILVYPSFHPLLQLNLPVSRKHQIGGLQLVSDLADSEEFLGNREYRPGDRLGLLDHAAWARLGFPIVHEFQQEYLCRIALLLDTQVADGSPEEKAAFESAVSLSAAVADVLSKQEYVIDLFAAGSHVYHFQAGRGLGYLDNILDILACVDSRKDNPFELLAPTLVEEIKEISTAVFVLLDWNRERETFVRQLRSLGVAVKIVVVRETLPSLDPTGISFGAGGIQCFAPRDLERGLRRL